MLRLLKVRLPLGSLSLRSQVFPTIVGMRIVPSLTNRRAHLKRVSRSRLRSKSWMVRGISPFEEPLLNERLLDLRAEEHHHWADEEN